MSKAINDLRRLVEQSEKSRYQMSAESGVAASVLCRLVSGERKSLTIETAERIAAAIGYEIIIRPTGRGRQVKHGKA